MQIKNAYVMEPDFIPAFDELLKKPMPAKQCLEMITCSEMITAEYNRLMKAQLMVLEQYCEKKPDGTLKFDANGNVVFKKAEFDKICTKEISDLKAGTLEIPLTNKVKIYEDDISTARKVFLLKDLIEIVEREKPVVPGQEPK